MSSIPRGSDFIHGLKDPQNIVIPHGIHKTVEARNEQARANKDQQAQVNAENEAVQNANLDIANQRRKRRLSSLFAGGRSILGAPAGRGAAAGAGFSGGGSSSFAAGSDFSGSDAGRGGTYRSYGGKEF